MSGDVRIWKVGTVGGAFQRLRIEVGGDLGGDAEEHDDLLRQLRDELLELDLQTVDRASASSAPAGAKGAGMLGDTLVVTLSNSAVLVALVGVLRSWIGRGEGRRITIHHGDDTIDVSGASAEQQAKLIESWIGGHADR